MPGGVVPLQIEQTLGPKRWCPLWCAIDPPPSLGSQHRNDYFGSSMPNNSSLRGCEKCRPGSGCDHLVDPNRTMVTNPVHPCEQCDRAKGSIYDRRADRALAMYSVTPLESREAEPRYDGILNPTHSMRMLRCDATAPLAQQCVGSRWCAESFVDEWNGWPWLGKRTRRT